MAAALDAGLGAPTEDTDWLPPFNGYGTCSGELRVLEWRPGGDDAFAAWLRVMFLRDDDGERLAAVTANTAGPADTVPVEFAGVRVGDTLGDLRALHPAAELFLDERIELWYAVDPTPGDEVEASFGSDEDDAVATTVAVPRYPCGD